MCMYVCVCARMCVCIYIHTRTRAHTHTHTYNPLQLRKGTQKAEVPRAHKVPCGPCSSLKRNLSSCLGLFLSLFGRLFITCTK